MKFLKTRFAWAVYILGAALVFLYILFPSDLLKEYLANRIHQAHPNLTVEIGRLKLGFPTALRLYDVSVYHSGWAIADLENLKISPNIVSLFLETTHISFQGNGYGGHFKGDMNIIGKADDGEMVIDADISGIQVDRLEALQAITTHRLSGILEGTLTVTTQMPRQALTGDLVLTDGKIELSQPLLAQKELTFDSIEAQLMFNGRSLTIEHCELIGNQLDGEVAGWIRFGNHLSSKTLDLTGNVRPHAEFAARLGDQIPKLLENNNWQTQGVAFNVKGPMESPTYTFN